MNNSNGFFKKLYEAVRLSRTTAKPHLPLFPVQLFTCLQLISPLKTFRRAPVATFALSFVLFFAITAIYTEPIKSGEPGRPPVVSHVDNPDGSSDTALYATVPDFRDNSLDFETPVLPPVPADLTRGPSGGYNGPGSVPAAGPEAAFSGWAPRDITRGETGRMELSLTFDGGFNGEEAVQILDILKDRGVKTTIFLTGVFMRRYPEITRRIVADGHEVGNHTMTHPHLTEYATNYTHKTLSGVDRKMIQRELMMAAELFKRLTGGEMAPLWRAPYGEVNMELRRWAFEAGYIHINWTYDYKRRESLDTLDWVTDTSSRLYLTSREIKERILNFGHDKKGITGGIILMHLGTARKTDKAAGVLAEMIDGIMEKGYRFVKVSELIDGSGEGAKALQTVDGRAKDIASKGIARLGGAAKKQLQ